MTYIKLEFFISTKKKEEILNSLKIDDKIEKSGVSIVSNTYDKGIHYIVRSSKLNVGFIRNTFNDIVICIKPLLDIINESNK